MVRPGVASRLQPPGAAMQRGVVGCGCPGTDGLDFGAAAARRRSRFSVRVRSAGVVDEAQLGAERAGCCSSCWRWLRHLVAMDDIVDACEDDRRRRRRRASVATW
jgi:hypothetical protein